MLCLLSVLGINTSVVVGYSTSLLKSMCSLCLSFCVSCPCLCLLLFHKKKRGNFPNAWLFFLCVVFYLLDHVVYILFRIVCPLAALHRSMLLMFELRNHLPGTKVVIAALQSKWG